MTEGNIFHGALTMDRLYSNRPTDGYNSYSTPIKGLYLCGSGIYYFQSKQLIQEEV